MRAYRILLFLFIVLISSPLVKAGEIGFDEALMYIDRYKDFAISEMERTGIPASIKMGQAILESDYGRSKLAMLATNHFGAKCHNTWTGGKYYHDDDAPNECFRKYNSVYESYVDHSYVLAKKRYASLFNLNPYDYKGWAVGLKSAGYATNPAYSGLLIKIIERYGLQNLDKYEEVPRFPQQISELPNHTGEVQIGMNLLADPVPASSMKLVRKTATQTNGLTYVYYDQEVSPDQIATTYQLAVQTVMQYNDMLPGFLFPRGTSIYLKEKRSECISGLSEHRVKEGETMYEISQAYGIKLRSLYHMNSVKFPKQPRAGQLLKLRTSSSGFVKKSDPPKPVVYQNQKTNSSYIGSPAVTAPASVAVSNMETKGAPAKHKQQSYSGYSDKASHVSNSPIYGSSKVQGSQPVVIKSEELFYHTVQSYETLITIAQAYGITVAKLKALNVPQGEELKLNAGMKLRID